MSAKNTALARTTLVSPFLSYFAAQGGDSDRLLRELSLNPSDFVDPANLIPISSAHALLARIADELSEPFIGARIGWLWAETNGPPFQEAKERATSLGQFFINLSRVFAIEATTGELSFSVSGESAVLRGIRSYQPGEAAKHGSAILVALIIGVLRNALGHRWNEKLVLVRTADNDVVPSWLIDPACVLSCEPREYLFRFPSDWCDAKPRFSKSSSAESEPRLPLSKIEKDVVGQLRRLILKGQRGRRLRLSDASAQLGLPPRKLQKLLAERGHTFRDLSRTVRLDAAKGLIVGTQDPIAEIAAKFGYDSPQNFSRDFRKEFGVRPSELRVNHNKG